MSTEERLARLGLLHLAHDPAALEAAMAKQSEAYDAKLAAWHQERERLLAQKELAEKASKAASPGGQVGQAKTAAQAPDKMTARRASVPQTPTPRTKK